MTNKNGFTVRLDGGKKINVRTSKTEYARITELASSRKMTISQYMRFAALNRRTSHKSELLMSLREIYFSIESAANKNGIEEHLAFELKQRLASIHETIETADSETLSRAKA